MEWLFALVVIIALVAIYIDVRKHFNEPQPNVEENREFLLDIAIKKVEENAAYIRSLEEYNERLRIENANFNNDNVRLRDEFQTLQHQKISADVKMGQKSENLLPFLADFPYKDDEIRGLFNPIDLIVFRPDEIVFIEVKTGSSTLSTKQKHIGKLIKDKKVRFETFRINEKGISKK